MRPIVAVPGAPQPLSIEEVHLERIEHRNAVRPSDLYQRQARRKLPLVVVFGVDPKRVRLHVVDKVLQVSWRSIHVMVSPARQRLVDADSVDVPNELTAGIEECAPNTARAHHAKRQLGLDGVRPLRETGTHRRRPPKAEDSLARLERARSSGLFARKANILQSNQLIPETLGPKRLIEHHGVLGVDRARRAQNRQPAPPDAKQDAGGAAILLSKLTLTSQGVIHPRICEPSRDHEVAGDPIDHPHARTMMHQFNARIRLPATS